MRIVNVIGGLGNQMFQYAFALALQKQFPEEEVLIDISHFNYFFIKKLGPANLHNGYELDKVFPNANNIATASARQLMKVTWYMPNYLLSRVVRKILPIRKSEYIQTLKEIFEYHDAPLKREGNTYYEGVWESVRYLNPVKQEILHAFAHPEPNSINAEYVRQMEGSHSVGIHVRRGDYLKDPGFAGVCEIDYYERAVAKILEEEKDYTFYIFSNDTEWCREHLLPLLGNHRTVFVTENKGKGSCWDMFLMSHCKELIIANSSFSWWGAFLNEHKGRVVAPQKWINRDSDVDIWQDDWIKV